jgi:hypothetical protein
MVTPLFAQTDAARVAPGAEALLADLLNKPAMVSPVVVTPLGRNWFRLETDAHIFSNEISVRQVEAVFLDVENYHVTLNGKRSKLSGTIINRTPDEIIADYVLTLIAPVINININLPYRGLTKILANNDTGFSMDVRQTTLDSEANKKVKNIHAIRHAEEVTINNRNYTYIRIYSIIDIDMGIALGARGMLERNADPANEEMLQMIIAAAKTK